MGVSGIVEVVREGGKRAEEMREFVDLEEHEGGIPPKKRACYPSLYPFIQNALLERRSPSPASNPPVAVNETA